MNRYYVGKSSNKPRGEVFRLDHTPTEADNLPYGYVLGPFVTLRAAMWACNPLTTFDTIASAERLALADSQYDHNPALLDSPLTESEYRRLSRASD